VNLDNLAKRLRKENDSMKEELRMYHEKFGELSEEDDFVSKKLKNVTNIANNVKVKYSYVGRRKMKELVQDFLNQKINRLPLSYMKNSPQECFNDIRDIYNWQMKEYVQELTTIQSKLVKYD